MNLASKDLLKKQNIKWQKKTSIQRGKNEQRFYRDFFNLEWDEIC